MMDADTAELRRVEANRVRGLRRRAEKLGWAIRKNRMRKEQQSPDYGKYRLIDTATNGKLTPADWSELNVVEDLISGEEKRRASS